MVHYPRILLSGDSAIVIQFGDEIDKIINFNVYALKDSLELDKTIKILSLIPSYCSLLVEYDILLHNQNEVINFVQSKIKLLKNKKFDDKKKKTIKIPVVYGGIFGPDIDYVLEYTKLSLDQLISIHSSIEYYVYMIGFSPGFQYLGGMDKRLYCPRLETPRINIQKGSVGIAGKQTGIYPSESPGGWRIIGRSPIELFNINNESPALISSRTYVKFIPISEKNISKF